MAERLAQLRRVASQIRHPWRLEVDGLDRLPEDALILAVNRVGPTDHLNVAASLGRPTTVVIQPESGLRPIPRLRRTSWTTDLDSLDHPAAVLARGQVLVVFPEVVAGNDGAVHKGHAEFAALAVARRTPIVPAALVPITRTDAGIKLRYRLRIGEPIGVDRFADLAETSDATDGLILRGLTDLVMTDISQLAGRRYRDDYTVGRSGLARNPASAARAEQSRQSRVERRVAEQQRRTAEAELARLLDEQDAVRLDEAAQAARRHAEQAALADEEARRRRRQSPA